MSFPVLSSRLLSHIETSLRSMMAAGGEGVTVWYQREVSLSPKKRGCHYITDDIISSCGKELSQIKIGVANVHSK